MDTIGFRIIVYAVTFLLALPPGWCCDFACCAKPESVGSCEPTCCQQGHDERSPGNDHAPAHRDDKCCCSRDATVPERQQTTVDVNELWTTGSPDNGLLGSQVRQTPDGSQPSGFLQGQRVRVLKCVWRC